jgi:hypothetical protein
MPRFQNKSGLNQVVVLNGVRTIVGNNGVFEAREGFLQSGIELVPDSTPLTVGNPLLKKRLVKQEIVQNLKDQIKSLENKIPNVEIQTIQSTSESNKNDILSLRNDIDSLIIKQKETEKVVNDFKELALKRLEILKSAIQALEAIVEEQYVIEDDGNTEVDVKEIERNLLK